MKTIIESVNVDWSSLVNRMKSDGSGELRDNVHSALGSLIKQRKVYYTGNKGYFLVGPAENSNANGCTATLFNNGSNLTNGIGTKFSHLRHSMRERSSSSTSANSNNNSPGRVKPRFRKFLNSFSIYSLLSVLCSFHFPSPNAFTDFYAHLALICTLYVFFAYFGRTTFPFLFDFLPIDLA